MTTKKNVINFLNGEKNKALQKANEELEAVYKKHVDDNRDAVTEMLTSIINKQNEIIAIDKPESNVPYFKHSSSRFYGPMSRYIDINSTWEKFDESTNKIVFRENGIESYLEEKKEYAENKSERELKKKIDKIKESWNSLINQIEQFPTAKDMIKVLKDNEIEYIEPKAQQNELSTLIIDKSSLHI